MPRNVITTTAALAAETRSLRDEQRLSPGPWWVGGSRPSAVGEEQGQPDQLGVGARSAASCRGCLASASVTLCTEPNLHRPRLQCVPGVLFPVPQPPPAGPSACPLRHISRLIASRMEEMADRLVVGKSAPSRVRLGCSRRGNHGADGNTS